MDKITDILQLRVLLAFNPEDKETTNVTKIARTLQLEKYQVSRLLKQLVDKGLVDKTNNRKPILTQLGKKKLAYYQERIALTINHLTYEGIDLDTAKKDAFAWALYNSDQTMNVIKSFEDQNKLKYELRNETQFNGNLICKYLKDGDYHFSFLIYRQQAKNGSNLSMANHGFEHPCILHVENGKGVIQLKSLEVSGKSISTGVKMVGHITSMKYFDNGDYISSETYGNIFLIPIDVINFVNVGSGMGQILHGSVPLVITTSVGLNHMPKSEAIFTLII